VVVESIQTKPLRGILSYSGAEVFRMVELLRDPSRHLFVPQHRRLSDQEKTDCEARGMESTKLPRIESTDIMARYLGLKPWDVVEVRQSSPSSGWSACYRVVVPAPPERILTS